MADRPTLADLRKLAVEALGPGADVGERYYDGWHCFATSGERGNGEMTTWGPQYAARRRLRELLKLMIVGRNAAERDTCEVCRVCIEPLPPPRCTDHAHHEPGDCDSEECGVCNG